MKPIDQKKAKLACGQSAGNPCRDSIVRRNPLAEIIRRVAEANAEAGSGNVVRQSNPPTLQERLQLLAARLHGTPIVIMPHKCRSNEEWVARYSDLTHR